MAAVVFHSTGSTPVSLLLPRSTNSERHTTPCQLAGKPPVMLLAPSRML